MKSLTDQLWQTLFLVKLQIFAINCRYRVCDSFGVKKFLADSATESWAKSVFSEVSDLYSEY